MSIDKWLDDNGPKKKKGKIEELFKTLSKEEVQELKEKSIKRITRFNDESKPEKVSKSDDFLNKVIEFKNWLEKRTYLKGDLDRIETWITNLSYFIKSEIVQETTFPSKSNRNKFIKKYKEIPPRFLDEKIRIAINKKINGNKLTSSDNYYLKKLKKNVQEKLKEAEYYKILKNILEL